MSNAALDSQVLDALLRQAPTPIWVTDLERIIFINDAAVQLLGGQSAESFVGHSPLEFIDSKYHEIVRRRIADAQHFGRHPSPIEEEFITLQGERIPVLVSGILLGRSALQIHFTDLRPVKQADASRAQLELVTNKLPALAAYLDRDLRYVAANQAYLHWTGQSPEQLIGKSTFELAQKHLGPAEVRRLELALSRCLQGEAVSLTLHGQYVSGARTVEAHYSPDFGPEGQVRGLVVLVVDVTEQRKTQQELQFRATLIEEALEPIFAWELPGPITYWNRAAEELYGYARDEALGRSSHDLLQTQAPIPIEKVEAMLHQTGLWQGQLSHRKKSGDRVLVESRLRAFSVGDRLFVTECTRDITQREEAQFRLRELATQLEARVAERTSALHHANEDLEAYGYSISHDLRAPLRTLQGFADALLEDYAGQIDQTGQNYLKRIRAAAQRMDSLINDLLEYSRLGRATLTGETVDLNTLIRDILTQQQSYLEKTGAMVEVDRNLPSVMGHYSTLIQIVGNLVSNALKFNRPAQIPQIHIGASQKTGVVRLWVRDHGIGIEPEHQERIFRVFERLHGQESYPGTGVGLAIVKRGAERLGGRVGVTSQPGAGSCFWVELPTGKQSKVEESSEAVA